MKTCIFQLYSPMVSWGEIAIGEERRTALQPSRSAIIGIVAAGLGITRDAEEELGRLAGDIHIAVRVDAPGTTLRDFHTIQVPRKRKGVIYYTRKSELEAFDEKDNAIISKREYRCDAYSLIAIYLQGNHWTLEQIADALRYPTFHLYLGRKSAPPALPLAPQIVDAENLKQAFAKASFDWPMPLDDDAPQWKVDSFKRAVENLSPGKTRHYYWEEGMPSGIAHLQRTERYDEPISRARWQFKRRTEYMAVEQVENEEVADVLQ